MSNTAFDLSSLKSFTESCKKHVDEWDNNVINHSDYWSCPTAVIRAIAEYGAENIFAVSSSYHGRYEDNYAYFTYYNNVTGKFFEDNWTTAFACPGYGSYECMYLDRANELGLVNKEKFYNVIKALYLESLNKMSLDNVYYKLKELSPFGLRVEVSKGRKWKGTGFLIGYFEKRYCWGVKKWRSNNDYGVATSCYAKVLDTTSGEINSVSADYVKFLDVDNLYEEYRKEMIKNLENTTVDNLHFGKYEFGYSPKSGDSHSVSYGIDFGNMTFYEWLNKNHSNKFDLSLYVDVEEEKKRKKAEEFKNKKMPELIEWVKNNTDKTTEEDILKLAEHIYNKNYGNKVE